MFGFRKNDQYTAIAIYAFIVLALLMLAVVFCINVPYLLDQLFRLLNILRPVTFAFVFAYICNPIVRYAENKLLTPLKGRPRFSRMLAITLTYLFLTAILLVLIFMIVPQIMNNYQDFSVNVGRYISVLTERVEGWLYDVGLLNENQTSLDQLFRVEDLAATVSAVIAWLGAQLGILGLRLLETTGVVLLGIVLSVYILYHKERIHTACKRMLAALFPQRVCNATLDSFRFADQAFGRFIVGKLIDSFIVGAISFIVLAIVNMPYYPLLSAIICVTSIIPAFGYVIGAIPCFLIVFIKDPIMAIWFLVILIVIQQLDGNIIGPKIVGSATGLASVWVITAIMLMGAYLGPIGWFIGVPLFSVIYRLVGNFVNYRLKKKNRPIALSYYEETPAILDPISTNGQESIPAEEGEEVSHEKVDE
jgi:predicted PurR-regulated permease PerM